MLCVSETMIHIDPPRRSELRRVPNTQSPITDPVHRLQKSPSDGDPNSNVQRGLSSTPEPRMIFP